MPPQNITPKAFAYKRHFRDGLAWTECLIQNSRLAYNEIFEGVKCYHSNLQYRRKEANEDRPSKRSYRQNGLCRGYH